MAHESAHPPTTATPTHSHTGCGLDVHTQLTGMLLHDGMVQPQETRGVCHSRQPQPTYCARAPLMLSPAEREAMTLRRPSPAHACMQRLLPPWSPHDSMRLGGLWCWCRWCSRCGRRRCGRLRPSSRLREERGQHLCARRRHGFLLGQAGGLILLRHPLTGFLRFPNNEMWSSRARPREKRG